MASYYQNKIEAYTYFVSAMNNGRTLSDIEESIFSKFGFGKTAIKTFLMQYEARNTREKVLMDAYNSKKKTLKGKKSRKTGIRELDSLLDSKPAKD